MPGPKKALLTLAFTIGFLNSGIAQWQLFNTQHPVDKYIVGIHINNAAGEIVPSDGSIDVSSLVQKAIDFMEESGGGILYFPAGIYKFSAGLTIHESVGIRGEFTIPGTDNIFNNTIFQIFGGRDNIDAPPFIIVKGSSSVDGIVFWYPGQLASDIRPYPPTLHIQTDGGKLKHCASIRNIFLVNSYTGIQVGPENMALPIIKNIYGSPLHLGLFLDNCTDVSRVYDLYFSPDYWANSGLDNAPPVDGIHKDYIYENATGIELNKTDNGYQGFFHVSGYNTGLLLTKSPTNGGSAGGLAYGLDITKGKYGIRAQDSHFGSFNISGSTIHGDSASILSENHAGRIQFNDCQFTGENYSLKVEDNGGVPNSYLSFQNCYFESPLEFSGQCLSVFNSEFNSESTPIVLTDNTRNAILLDNNFNFSNEIINNASDEVEIADNDYPYIDPPKFEYEPNIRKYPESNALFIATDYSGVIPNDETDDAPGIQNAINFAFTSGGGIVFMPPGVYNFDSEITIKEGVELRGTLDFPHHTGMLSVTPGNGTLIYVNHNINSNSGATIQLENNSGIRGLAFHYPIQSLASGVATKFPWLIRFKGDNIYAINVFASNPYQYLDLYTFQSNNHYLENVMGIQLSKGIQIGSGSDNGKLRNVHFNGTFWGQTAFPNAGGLDLDAWNLKNSDGFTLGDVSNEEMFQCFTINVRYGLSLIDGGPNGIAVNFGVDNSENALYAEANNGFNFISTSLINKEYAEIGRIIEFSDLMKDTIAIHNLRVLGQPKYLVQQKGKESKLILNQVAFRTSDPDQIIQIEDGSLELINAVYRNHTWVNTQTSSKPAVIYGNFFRGDLSFLGDTSSISDQYFTNPMDAYPEKSFIYNNSIPDLTSIRTPVSQVETEEDFKIIRENYQYFIDIQLNVPANIQIDLYDIMGKLIIKQPAQYFPEGHQRISLPDCDINYRGISILRLQINDRVLSRKIIF